MNQDVNTKKSILLVDDEPAILNLYRLMFKCMSQDWDLTCAANATEAITLMEQQPREVVVSDMRMPGKNGAQLMVEIMRRWPRTARIILSGYAEQESVAKCVGAAHQYLMKPCDITMLKSTLTRVCALDVFLRNDHLKTLVSRMAVVPSLPSLYFRVLEELQSPKTSLDRIGELVSMDPGMTAKLLQLVNSAFFGMRREISNPTEAVQLLGVATVRSLALTIHVFSCFDLTKHAEFSLERLWNHSLTTGLFARKIAEGESAEQAVVDEAFVAGLLHDVGKLMLMTNMPGEYRNVLALARAQRLQVWQAEAEIFGASHADVGSYLLGLWGLPVSIVEAIALHHQPSHNINREFSPLTAVHAANVLEHDHSGIVAEGVPAAMDADYLASLGFHDRVKVWRSVLNEILDQAQAA